MNALWAIGAVAVALAAALAACGDSEEEIAPAPTTAGATATATPMATPAPTPEPTPVATTPAVPANWPTYSNPDGLFTVRYPPGWFKTAGQVQFSSYDLNTLTSVRRPPEAVVVEVGYYEAAGSTACGALSVDPKSGEGSPDPAATATTLGGLPAWQIIRVQGDPAISEEDLTRIQGISVIYRGYCFNLAAYFTQKEPDTAIFDQIASTFEFTF